MGRVTLVHWNAAEARERLEQLRRCGHQADLHAAQDGAALRVYRSDPPDAFVIDLGRLPSEGRAVGTFLRQQKATRRVPIVFVGGQPEKVARTRALLPDATYTEWDGIARALGRALGRPTISPVVPGTMQGYSGTPLVKKLGIRAGSRVALVDAPDGFVRGLGALPDDVTMRAGTRGRADLIVLFAPSRADLGRRFSGAARALAEGGGLWIAWPKKGSGVASDLAEGLVRAFGLGRGFVDYKICAIDATWSGLKFARRRTATRPGRRASRSASR